MHRHKKGCITFLPDSIAFSSLMYFTCDLYQAVIIAFQNFCLYNALFSREVVSYNNFKKESIIKFPNFEMP